MDNKFIFRTATDHSTALASGEYTAVELVRACLDRAAMAAELGIYLELKPDFVLKQAEESDARRAEKRTLGPLDGIPVTLKDNLCVKDQLTTCASRILENFRAPYDAGVVEKLKSAGAVLFGRANMDEFAMGSSTENSAFQVTRNPWDPTKVPGGSSGGSAAAVAASIVPLALGSDTGGSIRQPAALCGVFGLKPTYGLVSRYGLVAFASSLDQIGPFARSTADIALLLNTIAGHDARDSTSLAESETVFAADAESAPSMKGLRVGVSIPASGSAGFDSDVISACHAAAGALEKAGATMVPLQSKLWDYAIPIYYILATAEASSNLSRYDGIRYGHRAHEPKDLLDLYVRSRTEGFGPEVKRRILLGTYVLSSGYFDAFYRSAERARVMIKKEYEGFFQKVDLILQPTSPTTAFGLGEKLTNPIAMYQSDLLTIAVNLAGVPSMSMPVGMDKNGLPIGLQLTAARLQESKMMRAATFLSSMPGFIPDYTRAMRIREGESLEKSTDYWKKNSRHNIPLVSQKTQKDKVNIPETRTHPTGSEKVSSKSELTEKAVKVADPGQGAKGERSQSKDHGQNRKQTVKKSGAAGHATPVKTQPKEGVNPMMKKKTAKKKTAKKKSSKKKASKKRR